MDEKTLRREQRQLRRAQRNAALEPRRRIKNITLTSLFENSDIKSKILCKAIENNSKVLNKKKLREIENDLTKIQFFDNLSSIDNEDKKVLLKARFGI